MTIAHGAVPAVQWPAMTMAFSATTDQLAGLNAGDQVAFEFRSEGAKATVVSIKKVK
ncbi:Cation efflux system protein CusF precursor [compost metagenome]